MVLRGNAVIAQGGGPTVVINESLAGALLELRKIPEIGRVYGALNGVRGILREDFIDLTRESATNIEAVARTPSAALFSTRDKPDDEYCSQILKVFKAHDIRYFFYIGGNDSVGTVETVRSYAQREDYEFRAIHVPKTIDNDIVCNDHTPGFGSAAKFVAQSFVGLNLDNISLPGIHIGVVMGRNSGFLTAASALARRFDDDGPHLIYLPERPFDMEKFAPDVKRVYEKYGRCLVAVSEGISDKNGALVSQNLKAAEVDAYGNIMLSNPGLGELLADHLKAVVKTERVRSDTLGYVQRSFGLCVSEVDRREARECGEAAVRFAVWEGRSGSVVIERTGDYAISYTMMNLDELSNRTRKMEDSFIGKSGTDVTESFKEYVRPIVGTGLLKAERLASPYVKKIVNKK